MKFYYFNVVVVWYFNRDFFFINYIWYVNIFFLVLDSCGYLKIVFIFFRESVFLSFKSLNIWVFILLNESLLLNELYYIIYG